MVKNSYADLKKKAATYAECNFNVCLRMKVKKSPSSSMIELIKERMRAAIKSDVHLDDAIKYYEGVLTQVYVVYTDTNRFDS